MNLAPFLIAFLFSRDKLPQSVVIAAAQCIFVLSDDNNHFASQLRNDSSCVACLVEVAQSESAPTSATPANPSAAAAVNVRHTQLRVLACAILKNLSPFPPMMPAAALDLDSAIVLPLMTPLLSGTSLSTIAERVQELVPLAEAEAQKALDNPSTKIAPKSDDRGEAQRELEVLEDGLRAVQLALEVLTGVCATLPDPEPAPEGEVEEEEPVEEDGDEEWAGEFCYLGFEFGEADAEIDDAQPSERDEDQILEMDVETGTDNDLSDSIALSQSPILALLPSLLALAHPTPLSFPPLPSSTAAVVSCPPITSVLGAVHVRALECVANVFLGREHSRLDGTQSSELWRGIWSALGAVGPFVDSAPAGHERRVEMWDAGAGALWGVSKASLGVLFPEEEPVRVLMEAIPSAARDPRLQVKLIGVLECLAQNRETVHANKAIADFLVSVLPPTSIGALTVEPTLQAASALIDIFADEEASYDVNFRAGRFTDRLNEAVLPLRKMVRAVDKKSDGGRELRARGDGVLENLVAFIKYRRGLGKGF